MQFLDKIARLRFFVYMDLTEETTIGQISQGDRQGSMNSTQMGGYDLEGGKRTKKGRFCQICKRKTCLKTGYLCVRLEKYLKRGEVTFWHGVESYLPNPTFNLMQNKLYGIENRGVTTENNDSIHI